MADRRRLVVGFGGNTRECGWAATADLVRYDLKRRSGEWETTHVGAAGQVQQLIVVDGHDTAVTLRERLNFQQHRSAAVIVERQGLPRRNVEAVALVLEASWRLDGTDHGLDFSALVWQVIDARADELDRIRTALTEALAMTQRATRSTHWWSDCGEFPFAAIVFDLDQTLVDSSSLGSADARRRWVADGDLELVREIEVRGSVSAHELPGLFAARRVPVAVATRAPRRYAERVLATFGIEVDALHAGSGDKAASIRACARDLGVKVTELVLIGDDASDISAAQTVGATSVGAAWGKGIWDDRRQPDISVVEPSLLLEHVDWRRLTYFAEQHDLEREPVTHAGSWITYGGLQTYALGRYFPSRSLRHSEFLTQAILQRKKTIDPERAVARALDRLGAHISEHAAVNVITSVPVSNGRLDRFARYRKITAGAFDADDQQVLREVRQVGSLKGMGREAREAANKGRFEADPSVEGMHVLVLDDVITFGSTLKACAQALREAGAAEVSCVSFSGTQD